MQNRSNGPAFTLVELLVAMATIAILVAMLVPTLQRGRRAAQSARCVANLRQLGIASHLYWDDNNGACFRYRVGSTNSGELYWFGWLASGAEGQRAFDVTAGALYPYLRARGVELCPAFDYFSPRVKLKASGASYGYGYNLFLSSAPNEAPVKITRLLRPGSCALFADAAQINTWQAPASPDHPMLEEWYYVDNTTNQPNGHFRHSKHANVVFCDGHVGPEKPLTGTTDKRMPESNVALLRRESLLVE